MDEMKQKLADQFTTIVQRGLYQDADELLSELRNDVNACDYLSEDLCITAAFLYNKLDNREKELYYLQNGLIINPSSSSLFVSLADYYSRTNIRQELICLYQARFLAKKAENKEQEKFIENIIDALEKNGTRVPATSIIILSYNTRDYIRQCLESVKDTVPLDRVQVIVVDNASNDGSVEYLRSLDWITLVENDENHGFPVGCNDGIKAAESENDIYLLDSNAILYNNSFFWLKMGLYENDEIGSTGSITNNALNEQRIELPDLDYEECKKKAENINIPLELPYGYKIFLLGFSLLLKRKVFDKIGLFDERFNPGNSDDVDLDLGLRILKEKKLNLLCMNSFVYHYGEKSFDQLDSSDEKYYDLVEKNRKKLEEKLGFNLKNSYSNVDLADEINEDRRAELHILEVGCGLGLQAAILKTKFPYCVYKGIESDNNVSQYAKAFGEIFDGDIESVETLDNNEKYFDYILLGDVLQLTHDPASVLHKLSRYLKENGRIIVSVPNVRHWSVVIPLLNDGRFSYTDNGVIKNGTYRFFTGNDIMRLISENGYSIKHIKTLAGDEPSDYEKECLRSIADIFDQPDIDDFLVEEYIISAQKTKL